MSELCKHCKVNHVWSIHGGNAQLCLDCKILKRNRLVSMVKKRCLGCSGEFLVGEGARFSLCRQCHDMYMVRKTGTLLDGICYTRELVRIRDKHTCQECGEIWQKGQRRFDVHHLNGLCGKLSRSYDKVREMGGLTTLCHKCHYNRHDFSQSKTYQHLNLLEV